MCNWAHKCLYAFVLIFSHACIILCLNSHMFTYSCAYMLTCSTCLYAHMFIYFACFSSQMFSCLGSHMLAYSHVHMLPCSHAYTLIFSYYCMFTCLHTYLHIFGCSHASIFTCLVMHMLIHPFDHHMIDFLSHVYFQYLSHIDKLWGLYAYRCSHRLIRQTTFIHYSIMIYEGQLLLGRLGCLTLSHLVP